MRKLLQLKWMAIDGLLSALSLGVAYAVLFSAFRFMPRSESQVEEMLVYLRQLGLMIGFVVLLRVAFFRAFGLYRGMSRFAGMHELRQIILATSSLALLLLVWNYAASFAGLSELESLRTKSWIPLSVLLVDWMSCIVLAGGARMLRRMLQLSRFNSGAAIHNILIIGADHLAENVARNFITNPQLGYRPVGLIAEDVDMVGRQIHGLRVLGTLQSLPQHAERLKVSDVVVALRSPSLTFLNRVVEVCEAAHVKFKIIPSPSDVMEERVAIHRMRPVEIEDLLGREQVDLQLDGEENNYLKDEVVLVTGAGGSIGSELSRQILAACPKKLILLGRGENSVFEVAMELGFHFDNNQLVLEVADIQDVDRMLQVFKRHQPTVVFHAAAHKHVPLMEMHPLEAVKNNIIGTYNVAMMSKKYAVKRFTLISTDKAVRPTSVMGASKRVAEMVISALSRDSEETAFLSVRFGNVLGSRGSVVPLFRKQIAAGGPVTVMHKEIERYFMTIPEAANLVIQAGAIGENGQLFILDMGKPIKIADLARRMITLSGYEPDVDIEIKYVGLRPGEKLYEELLTAGEDITPTSHPKILSTRVQVPDLEEVKSWLVGFQELQVEGNDRKAIERLMNIVPEYRPESQCMVNGRSDEEIPENSLQ